ncbi:30S ribosomal protein S3 [Candidatus Gottesmanbacteria bacterium RIFCSPLOWO2_01_FULL_48_11]|uniref:Small ribosomal subunit protein uS3 n=3 Tax=root TaxID=1 RepID=A0A0G1UP90_9BACT|nr:30S ribosomal protein S3 [uncultured organism]KKU95901.1 MAG: 30S ribosomal protein S3 [Candidatus Gottesmanbacteria bacterium GW2011_GWA1_48_13]OGG26598.1 MAG: 30S ribosomal protein S3 [Candidatus Gottesmanbacteria bacterium RIFCSPLOWO2_01_FULL_48_11]
MGQKINPKGFRIGPVFGWESRWFADDRRYKEFFMVDVKLREVLFEKLKNAGLAQVEIERSINKIKVTLHVARPGVVIGRGGSGLEDLKKSIEKFMTSIDKKKDLQGRLKLDVAVEPVKEPNLNAYLVATTVADQLAKRLPAKRVGNQAIERVMGAGAKGVKILLAGRIAGAEIARRERFQAGTVPLSTIREEVDFAAVPSLTRSGYIGVKVWICRK